MRGAGDAEVTIVPVRLFTTLDMVCASLGAGDRACERCRHRPFRQLAAPLPRRPAGTHSRTRTWGLPRPADHRRRAAVGRQLGPVAPDAARASVPGAHRAVHLSRPAATSGSGKRRIRRPSRSSPSRSTSAPMSRPAPSGWTAVRIRPTNAPHTWMGFSTGVWEGNMLTVTTTHIKQGWVRRNGLPESDGDAHRTLHPPRRHPHPRLRRDRSGVSHRAAGEERGVPAQRPRAAGRHVTMGVRSGGRDCGPVGRATCPAYFPDENPFLLEFRTDTGIPEIATRGGAETMYPEFIGHGSKTATPTSASRRCGRRPQRAAPAAAGRRQRAGRDRCPCAATSTCWSAPAATSRCRLATKACWSSTRRSRR